MDRWYVQFTLFNDIHRAQAAAYVCRVRDSRAFEVVKSVTAVGGRRGRGAPRPGRGG